MYRAPYEVAKCVIMVLLVQVPKYEECFLDVYQIDWYYTYLTITVV